MNLHWRDADGEKRDARRALAQRHDALRLAPLRRSTGARACCAGSSTAASAGASRATRSRARRCTSCSTSPSAETRRATRRRDALPEPLRGRLRAGDAVSGLPFAPGIPLRARLRLPLYRNGYALVASSAVTSVLGLVFWLVAARQYSAAVRRGERRAHLRDDAAGRPVAPQPEGRAQPLPPHRGAESARFARRSYLVALGVAAVAATVFIAGLALWSPELAFLRDRPLLALWFVAGTMAWTVFVLQDSVLAGIRQAGWVPAENLVFSVLKLGLLVVLAAAAPRPRRLRVVERRRARRGRADERPPLPPPRPAPRPGDEGRARADLGRAASRGYVAMDYVAYAIWSATIGVLPLVVLHVAGAEASAYFYVSWSIAYSLYLASSGMGQSLLAEASLDPVRLAEHARAHGRSRPRAWSSPPCSSSCSPRRCCSGCSARTTPTRPSRCCGCSRCRRSRSSSSRRTSTCCASRRRMRAVVATYGALCAVVLAVGIPLLAVIGIAGLGIGWLAAQTVVAGVIVVRRLDAEDLLRRVAALRRRALRRWRLVGSRRELETILRELAAAPDAPRADTILGHAGGLNDVLDLLRRARRVGSHRRRSSGPARRPATPRSRTTRGPSPRCAAAASRGATAASRRGSSRPGPCSGRRFVAERAMVGRPAADALREGMTEEQLLRVVDPGLEATAREPAADDDGRRGDAPRVGRRAGRAAAPRGRAPLRAARARRRGRRPRRRAARLARGHGGHDGLDARRPLPRQRARLRERPARHGRRRLGAGAARRPARGRPRAPARDDAHDHRGLRAGPVVARPAPRHARTVRGCCSRGSATSRGTSRSPTATGAAARGSGATSTPCSARSWTAPAAEPTGVRLAAETVRAAGRRALPFAPIALALAACGRGARPGRRPRDDRPRAGLRAPAAVRASRCSLLIASFVVTACRAARPHGAARRARPRARRAHPRDAVDPLRDAAVLVGLEARRHRRLHRAPRGGRDGRRLPAPSTTTGRGSSASTRCSAGSGTWTTWSRSRRGGRCSSTSSTSPRWCSCSPR